MKKGNLFELIPADLEKELCEALVENETIRIERIISKGHTSPESGWYDQAQHEWVVVLKGEASILFDDGVAVELNEGDHINIPAHKKHKVIKTSSNNETIWLAVHY